MKIYKEKELKIMSIKELKTIVVELASFMKCNVENIVPKYARKDLLISSILEAQEEAGGS